jgi:hypothetical protein
MTLRFLANNDTLLLKLRDNNYINEHKEETEDKDIKCKGVKDKGINRDGFNKEQIEDKDIKGLNEFNKEESQGFNNNFN